MTKNFSNNIKSESKFEFHYRNLKKLIDDAEYLITIPDFPWTDFNQYYSRKDKKGWWMVNKQIIIRKYISTYLAIIGNKIPFVDVYYIDLLSSWGMNRVTKYGGKDQLIFPGTSISAALISNRKFKGFNEFFINDFDTKKRDNLKQRLKVLSKSFDQPLNLNIITDQIQIDSNKWVIDVMKEIKEKSKNSNYLMVIDNQGLDIDYDTIKNIREIHNYGDIIIIFQDAGAARNLHNTEKIKRFFGREISSNMKKEKLCDIYINQLKNIGLDKIEQIRIEAESGFYYTLLFCCRKGVEASWLKKIRNYRESWFKKWTDKNVKNMIDIINKKVKRIDKFFINP